MSTIYELSDSSNDSSIATKDIHQQESKFNYCDIKDSLESSSYGNNKPPSVRYTLDEFSDDDLPYIANKKIKVTDEIPAPTVTTTSLNKFSSYLKSYPIDTDIVVKNTVDEVLKDKKSTNRKQKEFEKEAMRLKILEEREEKKRAKQLEKDLKTALKDCNKNLNREECMKFINVSLDIEIQNEIYVDELTKELEAAGISYKFNSHIFPNTIMWTRNNPSVSVNTSGGVHTSSETTELTEIILILGVTEFIKHVNEQSLRHHIENIKSVLDDSKLLLVIFGLGNYYKFQKAQYRKDLKEQNDFLKKSTDFKIFEGVPKDTVEYALTELQLVTSTCYFLLDDSQEFSHFLLQFTKSLAEVPYKLEKNNRDMQTDWYMSGDNKDCVSIDKNGHGLSRLWKQILTIFPLARLETAEAISSVYSTPSALMEAYDNCETIEEGQKLLQDLCIRRAAGPLTSVRKLGAELSKKVYQFFTSTDGDMLVKS